MAILALAGCAAVPTAPPTPGFVKVEVLYATDRAKTGSARPAEMYGKGRGTLEQGVAEVSIPHTHRAGELESPSWWSFEASPDPAKHVVVMSARALDAEDFARAIGRTTLPGQRNVLVFVHGFGTSFEDAVRRTGQIAYDLKFPGTPIAYSWPSQGTYNPLGYTTDETNAEWTEPHLKQFLLDLRRSTGSGAKIHLVAHSMGSRALTKVLRSIAADNKEAIFNQVVLAAPDIDREVFVRDIAPAILTIAQRTTLYASSQDKALKLSEEIHNYPRAGQSDPPLVLVRGLDTVDASSVDTSAVGHSYFAEEPLLLKDVFMLICQNRGPADRNLRAMTYSGAPYWALQR
jgi:esterase/lipase superfamily enzyme